MSSYMNPDRKSRSDVLKRKINTTVLNLNHINNYTYPNVDSKTSNKRNDEYKKQDSKEKKTEENLIKIIR